MILQLQTKQISVFWPAIKETIKKSCRLDKMYIDRYLNHCFASLLSNNHQCWIIYTNDNNNSNINGILITSLLKNKLFGNLSLSIDHMYAFTKWNNDIITVIFNQFVKYAAECDCTEIIADSNNVKAIDIAISLGATKETTKLHYKI